MIRDRKVMERLETENCAFVRIVIAGEKLLSMWVSFNSLKNDLTF